MLGHNHPCPEMEPVLRAGFLKGVDEPEPRTVFGKELVALVAGEGEEVGIARDVVVLDLLAML